MTAPRILVIDDDAEILEMTSLLLRGEGWAVDTAGSGEEGLARAQERDYALILLDINMPGMDGWEVLRILREDRATANVPVMMFTVNFEVREKLRALQQGATDYVVKPFDTEALVRRVRARLGARSGDRP
ncbi:MAG: response regulator [Acidobacteria bacterium]|nr:MAG: response regulator [Acidobacteriota bacterium]